MEPKELSPAMLQPQVTVVATLGELLATLPRQEEETLLESPKRLHRGLKEFAKELRVALHCIDDTRRRHIVTDDGDDPVPSLSRALAAYRSNPQTTWLRVAMAASEWKWSVAALEISWAKLAGAATKLRDTCRDLATKAADRAGTATSQGRELQAQAARDGTALERIGELGQALGGEEGAEVVARPESQVRREATEAASEATRATMVRQQLEAVLGLLQRLVAACDEATAFPWELQCLLRDIEATLEGTSEASPHVPKDSVATCDEAATFRSSLWRVFRHPKATLKGTKKKFPNVPEDLVVKVAMAELLWEASARLAKDHLLGIIYDITKFYFTSCPVSPGPCGVAERCQRAMEDIPRLLQPPERPQGVPEVSPVSTEPQELSPALLQPQVTVVATLGELLDTLPRREEEMMLLECLKHLHRGLKEFTKELWVTLYHTKNTWRHQKVTDDDDGGVSSLSQALAAYRSTPRTTWHHVTMVTSKWKGSVSVLVNRWAKLARRATKLRDTCRDLVTKAADRAGTATSQGRELQAQAARDGTALERMGELGQALGGEEGAGGAARLESPVREEDMVAASEARRATMVREQLEAALGLLEGLVAACDEATAFPRELQRLLRDTEAAVESTNAASPHVPKNSVAACDEAATFRSSLWRVFRHPTATLKGTKKKFPDVPEDLVAKVGEAERLWEANARLAEGHLLGIIYDVAKFYFHGGSAGTNALEVAEWCQRAIEDIPRLLRTPEHPQSVPEVSPVNTERQELSPAMLQPQVTVVATLGELLATLPAWEEMMLLESSKRLHRGLEEFTKELRVALRCIDDTWKRHIVTDDDDGGVTSLSRALAAYRSTPRSSRDDVARAASEWQRSVNLLVGSWAKLVRKATELRDTLFKVAVEAIIAELREWQDEAARDGTSPGHRVELGQAQGGEEGTEVVARSEFSVRREARVVASKATMATIVRQRLEAAQWRLQPLVAACDEATAFPRELQRLLRDTKIALKGTKKKFPNVPEDLVAKVAEAERLWEANARLAKDHLLGIIEDILDYCSKGGHARPCAHEVAKRCQRAMKDVPNLLQG